MSYQLITIIQQNNVIINRCINWKKIQNIFCTSDICSRLTIYVSYGPKLLLWTVIDEVKQYMRKKNLR